ncbi:MULTISPECIES: ComF family protein [unclassified Streptomyces]|uniref:ComF family protein n=1 Tax=unclassified Streptomyces TaxID=2593676 RepID=UPI0006AF67F9|nr:MULTISPECIES: ComF family protein [unclassified Streptomyces]KOX37031.1 phosphoribosyltransferase [Streptomyces sp. NRRL F-6491]KOX51853.1 phosphoribosyltransferase [Streptomyces sp. NRRL F-6492]
MRGWWREIAGLVLPVACGGCGRPRDELCPECAEALTGAGPRRVRPDPEPAGLPVVHAAAPYADAVREVLLAHKERGALALAGPLGGALAGAVEAAAGAVAGSGGGPLLLVPVPSSRRSVRARGHDPTRRIALAAAARLRRAGRDARVAPVLRQRRYVADQAGLGARGRLANLSGALEVVPGGAGLLAAGTVVLVDDLMTTGASLAEAARALEAVQLSFISEIPHGLPAGSAQHGFEQRAAAVIASSPASFEINRNSSRSWIVAGGER